MNNKNAIIAMSLLIFMYTVAAFIDAPLAESEDSYCLEMVEIFENSNGEYGWPEAVCK